MPYPGSKGGGHAKRTQRRRQGAGTTRAGDRTAAHRGLHRENGLVSGSAVKRPYRCGGSVSLD